MMSEVWCVKSWFGTVVPMELENGLLSVGKDLRNECHFSWFMGNESERGTNKSPEGKIEKVPRDIRRA